MKVYSARKIAALKPNELKDKLKGEFDLQFDDGVMRVNAKSTLISLYVWEFHRRFPLTPMLKEHHCASLTQGSEYGSNTHIKLLNTVMWATRDAYIGKSDAPSQMLLAHMVYEISNQIYNDLVLMTEEHVVSLDITDFTEVINNKKIKEVLSEESADKDYIDRSYSAIELGLKKDPSLANNNLARALKAGLIKQGQLLQCLGPRGSITDLDNHYFPVPITRGFTQGMRSFYNLLVESRSSSKSLGATKSQIKDAEYFARRLQILVQEVQTLHKGDCGSNHYLHWKVRDEDKDEDGHVHRNCDLDMLEGKYYLDEQTNQLKVLRRSDKHLIGKTIKLRSIVAGCNHPDPNGICETCLGELSLSIPPGTNLGHMCAAHMTEKMNQTIISTKHYIMGRAQIGAIKVRNEYRDYLSVNKAGTGYLFNKRLADAEAYMVVVPAMTPGLVDLATVDSVEELSTSLTSSITEIGIRAVLPKGKELRQALVVNVDRRKASFTYNMLRHIKQVGWTLDENKNYLIPLKGWDYSKTVMTLPDRQYDMSDHAKAVASKLELNLSTVNSDDVKPVEEHLVEVCDLVNSKVHVNIAALEVIVLGSLIRSRPLKNYFIPKGHTTKELGAAKDTVAHRSLSGAMAYDDAAARLIHPQSLFSDHRPQLPMDVFIKPDEVLKDPYRYTVYFKDN